MSSVYVCMYVCKQVHANAAHEYLCVYVWLRSTCHDSHVVTLPACMCITLAYACLCATNDACTDLLQVAALRPAVPARHHQAQAHLAAAARHHPRPGAVTNCTYSGQHGRVRMCLKALQWTRVFSHVSYCILVMFCIASESCFVLHLRHVLYCILDMFCIASESLFILQFIIIIEQQLIIKLFLP